MEPSIFFILLIFGFLNGFINATVGGGGLISTPLLLALGLNPYSALATTKLTFLSSAIAGSTKYYKAGFYDNRKLIFILMFLAFIGSVIGANLTFTVSSFALKVMIICMSILVIVTVLMKKPESKKLAYLSYRKKVLGFILIFLISIYAGSIGMGAGIFVILILTQILGKDYLKGSAYTNLFVLSITIGSSIIFLSKGAINFSFGIPLLFSTAVGGWAGSHVAIKKGEKFIKALNIVIAIGIILKLVIDFIK